MRSILLNGRSFACVLLVTLGAGAGPLVAGAAGAADKIPISTSSEAARKLYLQGRDLAEKLRATDARRFYEQAVAADESFALGYIGLANTSGTTREFIDATTHAAALAGQVSEGERHMILALEAAMKGDPADAHWGTRTGSSSGSMTRRTSSRSTRSSFQPTRTPTTHTPSC